MFNFTFSIPVAMQLVTIWSFATMFFTIASVIYQLKDNSTAVKLCANASNLFGMAFIAGAIYTDWFTGLIVLVIVSLVEHYGVNKANTLLSQHIQSKTPRM